MCETKASSKVCRVQQSWQIDGFRLIRENYKFGEKLNSDVFGDKAGSGEHTWVISMYPRGYNEDAKDFVSVFLQCVSAPPGSKKIACVKCLHKFMLADKSDKILAEYENVRDFPVGGGGGCVKFWKYLNAAESDSLMVVVEAEYFEDISILTTTMTAPRFDEKAATEKLLHAIKGLRASEQLTDFTINVVDAEKATSRKFNVHRILLALQSPVFAAMFGDGEWKEKSDGSMKFDEGESAEAVDAMLAFLYTGSCGDEYSAHVLNLAEKYHIDSLKAFCEVRLCANVAVDNVINLFRVSKMFPLEQLEAACRHLFVQEKKAVLKTDEWAELKKAKVEVACELLEFAAQER